MWLLVGLGNPGSRYARNRHNLGFRVIDELARRHDLGPLRSRFGGMVAAGPILGRHKVLLLQPMEYMNKSGFAVQQAAAFHGVEPAAICVAHDEIDLDFGRLKVKPGGGHGGHNGLRSLIEQLGSSAFARVRLGIGRPPRLEQAGAQQRDARDDARVAGYVLADFPAAQAPEVDALVARAADAMEAVVALGMQAAMKQFNTEDKKTPT
jgi:PTH1 family peptidyl-tRNA hydrolase